MMLNDTSTRGAPAGAWDTRARGKFSREYRRLFGAPPQRDVTRMRLAPALGVANLTSNGREAHRSWNGLTPSIDPTVVGVPINWRVLPGLQSAAAKC